MPKGMHQRLEESQQGTVPQYYGMLAGSGLSSAPEGREGQVDEGQGEGQVVEGLPGAVPIHR